MKPARKDLTPFGMERLNELRKLMSDRYWGKGPNASFWDELECILQVTTKSYEWERLDNDEVVLGEVWRQPVGKFYHKHTVHEFEYLYVASSGLAIAEHENKKPFHDGKQTLEIREWYIFPDGTMELCKKGCTHKLVNGYGEPIYVLLVKIGSNSNQITQHIV